MQLPRQVGKHAAVLVLILWRRGEPTVALWGAAGRRLRRYSGALLVSVRPVVVAAVNGQHRMVKVTLLEYQIVAVRLQTKRAMHMRFTSQNGQAFPR